MRFTVEALAGFGVIWMRWVTGEETVKFLFESSLGVRSASRAVWHCRVNLKIRGVYSFVCTFFSSSNPLPVIPIRYPILISTTQPPSPKLHLSHPPGNISPPSLTVPPPSPPPTPPTSPPSPQPPTPASPTQTPPPTAHT